MQGTKTIPVLVHTRIYVTPVSYKGFPSVVGLPSVYLLSDRWIVDSWILKVENSCYTFYMIQTEHCIVSLHESSIFN